MSLAFVESLRSLLSTSQYLRLVKYRVGLYQDEGRDREADTVEFSELSPLIAST